MDETNDRCTEDVEEDVVLCQTDECVSSKPAVSGEHELKELLNPQQQEIAGKSHLLQLIHSSVATTARNHPHLHLLPRRSSHPHDKENRNWWSKQKKLSASLMKQSLVHQATDNQVSLYIKSNFCELSELKLLQAYKSDHNCKLYY